MRKHMIKNKKGFTLVEVIVSVAILAIISVLFITLFVQALTINQTNAKINKNSIASSSNMTKGNVYSLNRGIGNLNFNGVTFAVETEVFESQGTVKYRMFRAKE
ncbi:type IV pilin protein [Anaerorhabdus sp.]|uniref:type IV pilin protein n=1 Tax=Anaerorhabdus sp. TaxID=1872524 RepID=UPI002FC8ED31